MFTTNETAKLQLAVSAIVTKHPISSSFDRSKLDLRVNSKMVDYKLIDAILDALKLERTIYNRESYDYYEFTQESYEVEYNIIATVGAEVTKTAFIHLYRVFNNLLNVSYQVGKKPAIEFQINYTKEFPGSEHSIVFEPSTISPGIGPSDVSERFYNYSREDEPFKKHWAMYEHHSYNFNFPPITRANYIEWLNRMDSFETEESYELPENHKPSFNSEYNYARFEKNGWNPFIEDVLDGEADAAWNLD